MKRACREAIRISVWSAVYQLAILLNRLAVDAETRESGDGFTSVKDASRRLLDDIEYTMVADEVHGS